MKTELINEIARGEYYLAYNGAKIPNSVLAAFDKQFFGYIDTEMYLDNKSRAFKILCLVYNE